MSAQTDGRMSIWSVFRIGGLVAAFGLMFSLTTLHAQSSLSGLAGEVKDSSGAVLPGVTVEAASPALIEKVRASVTDDRGQYKILDLSPGTYDLTFTLPGFGSVKQSRSRPDGRRLSDETAVVPANFTLERVTTAVFKAVNGAR